MNVKWIWDELNQFFISLQKPDLEKKATFFRLLAVCQKAWLGIRQSLVSLQWWESHKGMLLILWEMIDSLTKWSTLADAMENFPYFFNVDEIELLRSTEITGNMAQALEQIADSLEESQEINAKVKKALMYPILVLSISYFNTVCLVFSSKDRKM